jgi:hypothetical protein
MAAYSAGIAEMQQLAMNRLTGLGMLFAASRWRLHHVAP